MSSSSNDQSPVLSPAESTSGSKGSPDAQGQDGSGPSSSKSNSGYAVSDAERQAILRQYIDAEAGEEDENGRLVNGSGDEEDEDADEEGNLEGLVAGSEDEGGSDDDSSSDDSGDSDGDDDSDGSDGSGRGKRKRKRLQKRRVQVDDDDLALIRENQGLGPTEAEEDAAAVAAAGQPGGQDPFGMPFDPLDPAGVPPSAVGPSSGAGSGGPGPSDVLEEEIAEVDSDDSDGFLALTKEERRAQRNQRNRAKATALASGASMDQVRQFEEVFGSRGMQLMSLAGMGQQEEEVDAAAAERMGAGDQALMMAYRDDLLIDAEQAGQDGRAALQIKTRAEIEEEERVAGGGDGEDATAGMGASAQAALFLTPTDNRARRANGPERLFFWQGRRETSLRAVRELAGRSPLGKDWIDARTVGLGDAETQEAAGEQLKVLSEPSLPGATASALSIQTEARWMAGRLQGALRRELAHEFRVASLGSHAAAASAQERASELQLVLEAEQGAVAMQSLEEFARRVLWWVLRVKLEPVVIWMMHREVLPSFVRLRHVWLVLDLDSEWCSAQANRAILLQRLRESLENGQLDVLEASEAARRVDAAAQAGPSALDPCDGTGGLAMQDAAAHVEILLRGARATMDGLGGGSGTSGGQAGMKRDLYTLGCAAGARQLSNRLMLRPETFAESIEAGRKTLSVEDAVALQGAAVTDDIGLEAALEAMRTNALVDSSDCRRALVHVAQRELRRHPAFRQAVRETAVRLGNLSTSPTKQGLEKIDGLHPAFGLHAIRAKPLYEFVHDEEKGMSPQLPDARGSGAASDAMGGEFGGYLPGGTGDSGTGGGGDGQGEVGGALGLEVCDEQDPPMGRLLRGGGPQWLDMQGGYGSGRGAELAVVSGPGGQHAAVGVPMDGVGVECDGGDAGRVVVVGQLSARVGGPQQWLLLLQAEKEGLLTMDLELVAARAEAIQRLLPLYLSDSGSAEVAGLATDEAPIDALRSGSLRLEAVDAIRLEVLSLAVQQGLEVDAASDLRAMLTRRAVAAAQGQLARAIRGAAQAGPYRLPVQVRQAVARVQTAKLAKQAGREDGDATEGGLVRVDDDAETVGGRSLRVISAVSMPDGTAHAAVVDQRGEVLSSAELPRGRDARLQGLTSLIFQHAPHAGCVVATAQRDTSQLLDQLRLASIEAARLVEIARLRSVKERARRRRRRARRAGGADEDFESSDEEDEDEEAGAGAGGQVAMDGGPDAEGGFGAMEVQSGALRPAAVSRGLRELARPTQALDSKGGLYAHLAQDGRRWTRGGDWFRKTPRFSGYERRADGGVTVRHDTEPHTFHVTWASPELPLAVATSPAGKRQLPDMSIGSRAAVLAARHLQDPLASMASLWELRGSLQSGNHCSTAGIASVSEDLRALRLTECQHLLPATALQLAGERAMVESVACAGVDLHAVSKREHLVPALQFVPGLGPRKARAIVSQMSAGGGAAAAGRLHSRAALLRHHVLPRRVWANAAPFLCFPRSLGSALRASCMIECVGFAGAAGVAASKRLGRLHEAAAADEEAEAAGAGEGWDRIFDDGDADAHVEDEGGQVGLEADEVLARPDELGEGADDDYLDALAAEGGTERGLELRDDAAVARRRAALRSARRTMLSTDPHPLDALRVHPRHYDQCVQMAVAADQLGLEDAREQGREYDPLVGGDGSQVVAHHPMGCRDVLRGTVSRAQRVLQNWARQVVSNPAAVSKSAVAVGWRLRQGSACWPHEAWSPAEALVRLQWSEESGRCGAEGVCNGTSAVHLGGDLGFLKSREQKEAEAKNPEQPIGSVWMVAEPRDTLEEMDLPSFAQDLQSKGRQSFLRLLERIKGELRRPYGASRDPYTPPSNAAIFRWLTGETAASLRPGVVDSAVVVSARRSGLQLRFRDRIRAECGMDQLPDELTQAAARGEDIQAMLQRDTTIPVRVIGIDRVMRRIMVSVKPEMMRMPPPLPICDRYVDTEWAMEAVRKQLKQRQIAAAAASGQALPGGTGTRTRAIGHHAFRNASRESVEEELQSGPAFEGLFRPSSTGTDRLTLTYKLAEGPCCHVDVLEHNKDPSKGPLSLGRTLEVRGNKYSSLEEVLVLYLDAIRQKYQQLSASPKFRPAQEGVVDGMLRDMREREPKRVAYLLSPMTKRPGYYQISFVASRSGRVMRDAVSLYPDGFKWRGVVSPTVSSLIRDFKKRCLKPWPPKDQTSQAAAAAAEAPPAAGSSSQVAARGGSRWGAAAAPAAAPGGSSRWGSAAPTSASSAAAAGMPPAGGSRWGSSGPGVGAAAAPMGGYGPGAGIPPGAGGPPGYAGMGQPAPMPGQGQAPVPMHGVPGMQQPMQGQYGAQPAARSSRWN